MTRKFVTYQNSKQLLVFTSYTCFRVCQHCSRLEYVKKDSTFEKPTVQSVMEEFKECYNSDVEEIIFSGGDPLASIDITKGVLREIAELVDAGAVFRIGTRCFMQPQSLHQDILGAINAACEIATTTLAVQVNTLDELRLFLDFYKKLRYWTDVKTVLNQSVLLQTTDYRDYRTIFKTLAENGVVPYYIYNCAPKPWTSNLRYNVLQARAVYMAIVDGLPGYMKPRFVQMTTLGKAFLDESMSIEAISASPAYKVTAPSRFHCISRTDRNLIEFIDPYLGCESQVVCRDTLVSSSEPGYVY